jgi:ribosomal-protein-alanine N-acetyltransferase
MDLRIRRALSSDLDGLVELENVAFASERMSARQWRRHLESLSAEVLVAVSERRLVGAAVLFYRRGNGIARLYSIAVATDARGQGLGEALLLAAEQAARRRGSGALRLEVRVSNSAAQRLYERHDWRRFAARPRYYDDGEDAVRYEKSLKDAAAPAAQPA